MTSTSRNFAAILLLLLVAVDFGGGSLLTMLTRRIPGYLDNPLRQNIWRAGHAPPGCGWVLGLQRCGPRCERSGIRGRRQRVGISTVDITGVRW
jgi:hypothetical protein